MLASPKTRRDVETPLWRALQTAKKPRTVAQLAKLTSATRKSIDQRVGFWLRAGLVTGDASRPRRYRMSDNAPSTPLPPPCDRKGTVGARPITVQHRLWLAMRRLKAIDEVQLGFAVPAAKVGAIRSYMSLLHRAGFLRATRQACRRTGEIACYRLVRNTGPRSPSIETTGKGATRQQAVIDRNDGSRHPILRHGSTDADESNNTVNHV